MSPAWTSFVEQLPSQCEVCRRWGRGRLCSGCIARFAAPRPRCRQCALPLPGGAERCGECLRDAPPFEHAACVADYGFPWDRLIAEFKFHGAVELATVLARCVGEAARDMPAPSLLLPVPLAAGRLAERGYNQAWELARRIARRRDLPARADILLRPVDTAQQSELTRAERAANLRAAFVVDERRRPLLQGQRVALVDDVLTTGATARAAAQTLLSAGAAAVDVWVLARTP